jgi:hypothetical protein
MATRWSHPRGRHPGAVDDSRSDRPIRHVKADEHPGGVHGFRVSRVSVATGTAAPADSFPAMSRRYGGRAKSAELTRTRSSEPSTGRRLAPGSTRYQPATVSSTVEPTARAFCILQTITEKIGSASPSLGWATGEISPTINRRGTRLPRDGDV